MGFGFPPRVLALVHPAHPESLCILLPSWHASFGSPLLHMTLRHFQLLLSHLAVSKTAILVSPVMHRTSPCRTCERFPLAKKSTIDMRFSAGFRFSLDLPTAIAEFSSPVSVRFKPATHPFIPLTGRPALQMTKGDRRTPKRLRSSAC